MASNSMTAGPAADRFPSDEARTVRLTIPARPEYITLCRLALTGISRLRPLSEELLADLKLALTEAASNSVRHAYGDHTGGVVEIVYELHPDRLVIEVSDEGGGFLPGQGGREPGSLTEGGLGIAIIRAIADEVEIGSRPNGKGSRLRFIKTLT
ncbi:MAG: ATP-binding protein [Actinobacteria bacterium]|nr:MAG: ATP-binding protein [Actinomycetota bacterium]